LAVMLRRALSVVAFVWLCPSLASSEPVPLAAPSGRLGAGLGMDESPTGRAWAELGYHTQERLTIVAPTLGVGFMVAPAVELEAVVPLSFVSTTGESGVGNGNLYVGVNYVRLDSALRVKLGGGLALPTAARSGKAGEAFVLGHHFLGSRRRAGVYRAISSRSDRLWIPRHALYDPARPAAWLRVRQGQVLGAALRGRSCVLMTRRESMSAGRRSEEVEQP
jgi:hypothetical protein